MNISNAAIPNFLTAFVAPEYYISENAIEEAIQQQSMFTGGIHYLLPVDYGLGVGKEIGVFVVEKIKTKNGKNRN